ncbi:N-acetylmuramoyl-L-alanine amidase [Companilactobacillus sp. RD055328]|uniref:N-acetylmuramoyl-L-alanine amidase n=1 Tax=Companilactobacillus sp. RD055328 TaxID=2916634 RepID=UPI001FC81EE5|nr:N-acetylmuramoyl-L-alanine amidase [Companilactobacillus sp. RD055328]GKQ42649.1 N-acetylmuramoyl-L-alanine amidase [Companilactobacillus sp. RD055328]
MKKIIHLFKQYLNKYWTFILIAILLIISTTSTVALANLSTVTVKANAVNVRVGPGLSYDLITQVKKDEKLTIIDKKNSWWQVRLAGDKVGWVASWLVDNTEVSPSSNHIGIISQNGANVYKTDDTTSELLGTLQANQKVNVVYQENNWNQILFGKTVGWVQNDDIQTTGKIADTVNKPDSKNTENNKTSNRKLKEDNIKTVTTIQAGVTLRENATTSSAEITKLPANKTMTFLEKENDWYKVKTKSGTVGWVASWLVSISDTDKPVKINANNLSEATIVLDAGHGGKDVGAESSTNKHEAGYTLKTVKAIRDKLKQSGANVILTRDSDKTVALGPRARLSNKKKADAFISIHFDSSASTNSASGFTTYYYDNARDSKLASSINSQLKGLKLDNRGTAFGDYYVLRENDRPSVLLEMGYINSDKDFAQIKTKAYREKIADDVYRGLQEYFK